MPRVRSPNYPALSLPEAIKKAEQVFAKENRHLAPKEVVAKDMGYGGVNGASLGAISAVLKYGLLERQGEDYRATERLLAILHPRTTQEKSEAIITAAAEPALFADLNKDFPGGPPSDDNLRAYLVRRGFNPTALGDVIRSYRETIDLVKAETGGYNVPIRYDDEPAPPPSVERQRSSAEEDFADRKPVVQQRSYATQVIRASGGEPFRVSFVGKGIEIAGRVETKEDADELVRAVEALKLLLKPVEKTQPNASSIEPNPDERGEARRTAFVSLMITQEQKRALREMGHSEKDIEEMTPVQAHKLLGLVSTRSEN